MVAVEISLVFPTKVLLIWFGTGEELIPAAIQTIRIPAFSGAIATSKPATGIPFASWSRVV